MISGVRYGHMQSKWDDPLSFGVQALIEFNNLIINDRYQEDRIRVLQIAGLDDADVSDNREATPGDHGEFAYDAFYRGRTLVLTGDMQAGSLGVLKRMERDLKAAFAPLTEAPMKFRWFDVVDSFDDPATVQAAGNYTALSGSLSTFQAVGGLLTIGASSLFPVNLITNPSAEASQAGWNPTTPVRTNLVPNPSGEGDPSLPGWAASVPTRTNLVTNPSFEYGTAGWTTAAGTFLDNGATLTQDATTTVSGAKSGKIVTTNTNPNPGAMLNLPGTFSNGVTYAISMYVKGNVGGESLLMFVGSYGTPSDHGYNSVTITNGWVRYTWTWTPSADRTDAIIGLRNNANGVLTYFVDAIQITSGSTQLSYFDGDTPGYGWTGVPGASTSSNTATVTNLVTKPRFEDSATTGWLTTADWFLGTGGAVTAPTTGGSAISGGTRSMQLVTTASGLQGARLPITGTFKQGVTYVATVRIKGAVGGEALNFYMGDNGAGAGDFATAGAITATTSFVEYRVTWTPNADRVAGEVVIRGGGAAFTIYVDAVGVFASSNNTGYFDGTFPGASWTGAAYASTSTRSAAGMVQNVFVGNSDFETNTTGWVTSDAQWLGSSGATLTRDTTIKRSGSASGKIVTTAASLQQGVKSPSMLGTVTNGVPVTISVWARGAVGGESVRLVFGRGATAQFVVLTFQTLTTAWQQFVMTFTPNANDTTLYFAAMSEGSVARTFYIDDIEVLFGTNPSAGATGSLQTSFTGATTGAWWMGSGSSTLSNSVLPALTQSSDWAAAGTKSFRYLNGGSGPGGGSNFIITRGPSIPTVNGQTYAFSFSYKGTGAITWVQNRDSGTTLGALTLDGTQRTLSGTFVGDGSPVYFSLGSWDNVFGDVYYDSFLLVQASTVPTYFDGDTLGYNWKATPHNSQSTNVAGAPVTNLCTNPSFETDAVGGAPTGWGNSTTSCTLAVDGQGLFGSRSMRMTATATSRIYTAFALTGLTNGVTYTCSFWAKASASGKSAYMQMDSTAGSEIAISTAGWTRMTVTAVAAGTTATLYVAFDSLTTGDSVWVDGALVAAGAASTHPDFFDGDTLGAVWTGTRGASTSTSYQGAVLNLVGNPNFEAGVAGWSTAANPTIGNPANSATIVQHAGGYSGGFAGRLTGDGVGQAQAAYITITGTLKQGVTYTATVKIKKISGDGQCWVMLRDSVTGTDNSNLAITTTTSYVEYRVTWTPTADRVNPVLMIWVNQTIANNVVDIDEVGVYQGSGWTGGTAGKDSGYFDGSFPNASWTGTANASISKRDPAGIINLVPNSSFENDANGANPVGWNKFGGTFTADTSQFHSGTRSGKMIWGAGNSGSWLQANTLPTLPPGTYTWAAWVKGNAGGEVVAIDFNGTGGGNVTLTAGWQRLTVTVTITSSLAGSPFYIYCRSAAATTIFVDDVSMTQTNAAPAYFDGSNSGAFWGGAAGNSYSILPTLTRDSTWAASGVTSFRFANAPITGEIPASTGPAFNVTAAQQYGARVATNAKVLSGPAVNAQVLWSTGGTSLIGAVGAGVGNSTAVVTAPGGATSGQVQLVANGTGGVLDVDFDAVLVSQGSSVPAYFDGDTAGHFWTGTPELSTSGTIVGSQLVRSSEQRVYGDSQQTARVIVGSITGVNSISFLPKIKDASNYVSCSYNQASGVPTISITAAVAGLSYTLASLTIPTAQRPVAGQSVWLRGRIEGDLLTVEYWTSKPADDTLPASYLTAWLTGSDADLFGSGIVSQVGFGSNVTDGTWALDDYRIESLAPGDISFHARKVGKMQITPQLTPTRFKNTWQATVRASKFIAQSATQMRSQVLVPVVGTTPVLGRVYPRTYPLSYRRYLPGTITQASSILNVNNKGTVFTKGKIFVFGAISSLVLINLVNGQQMAWTGVLADGDYLVFDCDKKTVVNSSGQNMAQYFVPTSQWLVLEPGWNDIYVAGSGYSSNTRVVVFGRHGWM